MFTVESLRQYPSVVKALTGLPAEEFWALVAAMTERWADEQRQRRVRPDRQRAEGGGRRCARDLALRTAVVLTSLRLHVPQAVVGARFGTSQAAVSRELGAVLPALRVSRPGDDATQRRYYSGKKKAHTLKTQLVTADDHHILAISAAVPGATHDKPLCDGLHTLARLPDGAEALADKGDQGLAAQAEALALCDVASRAERTQPRLTARTPHKKPQGGELTAEQRAANRQLGAVRIRVEHCIGWLKHWAVLATRFRCAHDHYTPIMQTICGLVNAQTARWQATQRAYSA